MKSLSTIVIIGNCQAQFLEGLFASADCTLKVDNVPPNYMLTEADRDAIQSKMDAASVIFIQRTADDFDQDWLRSSAVLNRYAGKTWIWPNLYFDGYFPKTRYVYLANWGKLQSPLEDYHLPPVLQAYKAGQSVEQAATRLREDPCGTPAPFEASLDSLRQREKDCTVTISDYVENAVYKTKCFYTPNHPHTFLLVEMARRLAQAAEVPFNVSQAMTFPYKLDKVDLPVFDWIMKQYQLGFDCQDRYKGLSIERINSNSVTFGGTEFYDFVAVSQKFYEIYKAAL